MGLPHRTVRTVLLACTLSLLAACHVPAAQAKSAPAAAITAVRGEVAEATVPTVAAVRESVATAVTPVVLAVRTEAQETLATETASTPVSQAAVALIVRFEISSPAYYSCCLDRPVWPGAASGITWGIGYDGGHQTAPAITQDWRAHPSVEELAATAGIIGQRARSALPGYRHIVTPLAMAQRVFAQSTLPDYAALAARTFANGWSALPPNARGALVATVYNRGASMRGARRREMRVLRDECVPVGDLACMAAQFRSMRRLWRGTSVEDGLHNRYTATAQLAVSS